MMTLITLKELGLYPRNFFQRCRSGIEGARKNNPNVIDPTTS